MTVQGFILPLHDAASSAELFLAANPTGCFFCGPLGVADVVMVRTAGGEKAPLRPIPVTARGRLKISAGSACDTALYLLVDADVVTKTRR